MKLDPEEHGIVGPGWEERRPFRAERRARWEVRAAQWRTLELAQHAFGEEAEARLAGYPPRGFFRGLLTLRVPFRELGDHRRRELHFRAMAAQDPLLRRVPLIFVLEPAPLQVPLP